MNYYATYDNNNELTGFSTIQPVSGNYVVMDVEVWSYIVSQQFNGKVTFTGVESGMTITIKNVTIGAKTKIPVVDKNKIMGEQLLSLSQQVATLGQVVTSLMLANKPNDTK